MSWFWKNGKTSNEDKNEKEEALTKMGAGLAAANSAQASVQKAATTFAKPDSYAGNRTIYDSGSAKYQAKMAAFGDGNTVVDPYTGKKLVLTKQEAKLLYGEKWTEHLAESDHVKPLEKIYDDTKNNAWNTTDDIKNAANSEDNLQITSRKYNNAKRSRTNQELVEDEAYLKEKGVRVTEEGKQRAIADAENAERSINAQLNKAAVKNVVKTGHQAGMAGAQNAGVTAVTMSGIMNVVALIKGEKTAEEAIADTVKTGGKAAVTGYVTSGGLTVACHSLSTASSQFVRSLAQSNVPGQVITAVMVCGDTIKKWGSGEITTRECMIELGGKGLNLATMGYSMAVGQTLIPIPVVGAAVGALVGSLLTSALYQELTGLLQRRHLEHLERMRIIEECRMAAEQARIYRKELEELINAYLSEYRACFREAISSMKFAFQAGDADGVIAGANDITRKLGGTVRYENVKEFKQFLRNDEVDEF